jgi:1,4-alpha-glucan branching enzyme
MQQLVKDLNRLYHSRPELHYYEFEWQGFSWVDCHDADQSILSYLRKKNDDFLVVVVSFTPVPRHGYRIGVPRAGRYTEILNSDSHFYGGSGVGNGGVELIAEEQPWMEHPYSIVITVPPLGGLVLMPEPLPEPVAVATVEEETPLAEATPATPAPAAAAPAKSAPAVSKEELAQPE